MFESKLCCALKVNCVFFNIYAFPLILFFFYVCCISSLIKSKLGSNSSRLHFEKLTIMREVGAGRFLHQISEMQCSAGQGEH